MNLSLRWRKCIRLDGAVSRGICEDPHDDGSLFAGKRPDHHRGVNRAHTRNRGRPLRVGAIHPAPHDGRAAGRGSNRRGDAGGPTRFRATVVTLTCSTGSALRHWDEAEDEVVMITEGRLCRSGMAARR